MLICLIFAVVVFLATLICFIVDDEVFYSDSITVAFIFSLVGALAGFIVASTIGIFFFPTPQMTANYNLIELSDGHTTTGHFFLGSGSLSGNAVFDYYQDDAGTITLHQVDADISKIKYTEGAPYVEVTYPSCTNPWIIQNHCDVSLHSTYTFHIPTGSVNNSYSLPTK